MSLEPKGGFGLFGLKEKDLRDATGELVALDSEDRSLSVAQARHLARAKMLITALDNLYEIGLNPSVKAGDRVTALKEIVKFASEAQGEGSKRVEALSPEAARILLRLGQGTAPPVDRRGMVQDEEGEERVVPGDANGSGLGDSGEVPE